MGIFIKVDIVKLEKWYSKWRLFSILTAGLGLFFTIVGVITRIVSSIIGGFINDPVLDALSSFDFFMAMILVMAIGLGIYATLQELSQRVLGIPIDTQYPSSIAKVIKDVKT